MPRKSKTTSSEKRFSAVPPKAVAPVTPVAAKPVAEVKAPAAPAVVAFDGLLESLKNIDADVAREAATSLGAAGNPAAVPVLIEVLKNTNHYFHSVVRSAAASSLAALKDLRAVDALIEAVSDPITDSSTEAIHALVALGDRRAVAKLVEVTRNANNFFAGSVRHAAVAGLIKFGGEPAGAELKRLAAETDEDATIREQAAQAVKPVTVKA